MSSIHSAQVAGLFYPADPDELRGMIEKFFKQCVCQEKIPKAIIVPHAGYIYSGMIAASAYCTFKKVSHSIKRVILFGPSHRVPFRGVAVSAADVFETPLGQVSIDKESVKQALTLSSVQINNNAFYGEHCLEVQLPFLQMVLSDFSMVPFLIGDATMNQVAEVMDLLWGDDETLIVVSSDLSHYYNDQTAKMMDQLTANAILDLEPERIDTEQACGRIGIQALLLSAKKKNLNPQLLDLRNSGDIVGMKKQVVGYGAFGFYTR